jgi:uncharacterized membrane protein YhhN
MKKITWIILYLVILIVHLYAVYSDNRQMQLICKPLLMPVLAAWFMICTRSFVSGLKTWIILALFFSWVGDILLMFDDRSANFFLFGLVSFLIAQVMYIIFFNNLRIREDIKGNAWLLLLVVIYYAVLISVLSPHLGDMKLAVRIYGVVISLMLTLALHMFFNKNKNAAAWMIAGAILFITSDSLLAFNKYYSPIQYGGILIMLTYGLAQLFIVAGAKKYIVNSQ